MERERVWGEEERGCVREKGGEEDREREEEGEMGKERAREGERKKKRETERQW